MYSLLDPSSCSLGVDRALVLSWISTPDLVPFLQHVTNLILIFRTLRSGLDDTITHIAREEVTLDAING